MRDVGEREEISSWKSFSSVSILILGKCCASKKKMAAWWYARVWDFGYCCDFVKWRACGHENVVTREPRSRGTTILKDAASCRPCSPRKPTADEENSHHRNHPRPNPIGRGVLIHGIAHHPRTRTIVKFVQDVRESWDDRILPRLLQRSKEFHCIYDNIYY